MCAAARHQSSSGMRTTGTRSPFREPSPESLPPCTLAQSRPTHRICASVGVTQISGRKGQRRLSFSSLSLSLFSKSKSQGGRESPSSRLTKEHQDHIKACLKHLLMSILSPIHLSAGNPHAIEDINHGGCPGPVDLFLLNYTSSGAAE